MNATTGNVNAKQVGSIDPDTVDNPAVLPPNPDGPGAPDAVPEPEWPEDLPGLEPERERERELVTAENGAIMP